MHLVFFSFWISFLDPMILTVGYQITSMPLSPHRKRRGVSLFFLGPAFSLSVLL